MVETQSGKILEGEIAVAEAINLLTIVGSAIASEATIYDLRKVPGFQPSLAEGIVDCA